MNKHYKTALRLSYITVIAAFFASVTGLWANIYNDNELIKSALRGNDIATLILAIPLMLWSIWSMKKGSVKGQLMWMGTLGYMLYNYLFYLYGAAFNVLFLVYVLLFVSSVYALIFALSGTDINAVAKMFETKVKSGFAGAYMLFFSLLLGGLWMFFSLNYVFTGNVPQSIVEQGTHTSVVFATDLAVLIPAIIISALYLLKRKPAGYVFSTIVLVKASTYGLALIIMSLFSWHETGTMDSLIGLWIFLSAGCILCLYELIRNIKKPVK